MEKIVLELTKGEVLMLQELTKDINSGYAWMVDLAESLRKKATEAYKKPTMDKRDYKEQVEKVGNLFKGEPIEWRMKRAKERELKFWNEVEE